MKRLLLSFVGLALIAMAAGCDGDPARPKKVIPSGYNNLTEKTDVLFNLEQAYNQRDWDHYVEILDPVDFVFFFSPGDVGNDGIPEYWGPAEESQSAKTMFSKGGGKDGNPILSINLELVGLESVTWTEFDNTDYPGWYETTLRYNFRIETEADRTLITSGIPRAQFRIRQDADGFWRLVQWNDVVTRRAVGDVASAATEETSWGAVKALYGP